MPRYQVTIKRARKVWEEVTVFVDATSKEDAEAAIREADDPPDVGWINIDEDVADWSCSAEEAPLAMGPDIRRVFAVSNRHLDATCRALFNSLDGPLVAPIALRDESPYFDGYVFADEGVDHPVLEKLIRQARKYGCEWLYFSHTGPLLPGFDVF